MKYLLLAALLLAASAAAVSASGLIWMDDFESYANQAEFDAVWLPATSPMLLVTPTPAGPSPTHGIMQDLTARSSRRAIGQAVASDELYLGFWFYDGSPALSRTYGMAYARSGSGAWENSLDQLLAIGKYHTIASTKYFARVAFGTSAPAGGGWFTLDSGPDRSIGWHFAEIKSNPVAATFEFYIDGMLGGSIANTTPAANFNWVVMGSGLSTTYGMAFDNVGVGIVPEPASLLTLAGALLGLPLLRRTR